MANLLDGYVKGTDYNNGNWGVKTLGTRDKGAILFQINVSGKDNDGNKQYASIEGKVNIKDANEGARVMALVQENELCQFEGFFTPNNYTNKEGKEIRRVQFLVFDSTTFVKKQLQSEVQAESTGVVGASDVW